MGGSFWELLIALVVVVIFFFLAWFVTRLVATNGSMTGKGKHIIVLEKLPLTRDSFLMIVRVFDRVLLVGVTPQGMTTLKELDSAEVDFTEGEIKKQDFASVFGNMLNTAFPDGKMRSALDRIMKKKGGEEPHDE